MYRAPALAHKPLAPTLDQEDVAGVDEAERPVGEAQPQRAAIVEALERPLALLGRQRRAERMRGLEPVAADRGESFAAPAVEPAREALGEVLQEDCRVRRGGAQRGEAGGGAVGEARRLGEIDAEADDDRLAFPLEQDAGELGAVRDQVVRPFEAKTGRVGGSGVVQGDGGDQRQSRRGRIVGAKPHQGARMEVAGRRFPLPPLPPLAAGLALGAQPEALAGAFARQRGEIVVGGAGFGDRADQNSTAAAARVARSSTGMAR